KVNDYLIFKGPYGRFYFTEKIKNDLYLISGGCGISAMMSIIRYCTAKKLQNKLKLIYSVKTPSDIVYYEEIKKTKGQNPNFSYTITLTRPLPGHNWAGKTGRVGVAFLKEAISNVEDSLYFLCGPMDFVKSIIGMLEIIGVKKEQIRTDVWGR
ncbi:MAG: oxidoreductase, partial [Nanoarchaeota archaeon]|nr:oxidoreductase [Nanoarchaeota archaeon]